MPPLMFSIDQNCHSLWDVIPKLQAIVATGRRVRHFVEDIDVAFTALGSRVDQPQLKLARERYHRSGGADWGAALFYSEFLGRLPVEIRQWEGVTGLKTNVLAHHLGRTVDDLYDEFSPGDNWQLIGSSYVGDREHHRLIADLTVKETAEFLRRVLEEARRDTLCRFPEKVPQSRIVEWFDFEWRRLEDLIREHASGKLVDLYASWLGQYVGENVELDVTSSLMVAREEAAGTELLRMWCRHYEQAAVMYHRAIEESGCDIRPLKTEQGELPFFITTSHNGRMVRGGIYFRDGCLHAGGNSFPLGNDGSIPIKALREAGVACLSGKAVMLAIQVRMGDGGAPLALPYRGSVYMPAVRRFSAALVRGGLLNCRLASIVRVRLRLLDRMKVLDTIIRLPEHLVGYFGAAEIHARRLGEEYPNLARAASDRLEKFRTERGRLQWQKDGFPELFACLHRLDAQRRKLAAENPKAPEIRSLWKQVKAVQNDLLAHLLRQIARDWQIRDIDYWDSRGAVLPWAIALGGKSFYDDLIARAEIYHEGDEAK